MNRRSNYRSWLIEICAPIIPPLLLTKKVSNKIKCRLIHRLVGVFDVTTYNKQ